MTNLDHHLKAALQQQRRLALYRQRDIVQSPQSVVLTIDGIRYLSFCSNDYLALANHPRVIESFKQAAERYGVGSGASHLISGHSQAHQQLEEQLAAFTGSQAALVFSTGYMANLGCIAALVNEKDSVICDRLNHASLLDAAKLSGAKLRRYLHNDMTSLEQKLQRKREGSRLVVSDAVFSMDGDIAPIHELQQLCQRYDSWLMLDDAHGFGVLGVDGRGSLYLPGIARSATPIYMATLGKAIGVSGAFIAGSQDLIDYLIQFSRSYVYTTAMPAALAAATSESLRVAMDESWRREKLQSLIAYFRRAAAQLGLNLLDSFTAIQPVMIGDTTKAMAIKERCRQKGLLVAAIRAPTVAKGSERLRITLSAGHSNDDIDRLLATLSEECR